MKYLLFLLTHSLLFFSILLILMSLQGAIWIQIFSPFPSPYLWLTYIIYGAFYRSTIEAIILTYIVSLVATSFLDLPLGLFLCCNALIMLALLILKSRFMIIRPPFLALLTLFISFIYPVLHHVLSILTESNPNKDFEFINWFMCSTLTALISMYLYQFYIWFDSIMNKQWPAEVGRY